MYKSEEHDKVVSAFCNILPEKDLIAKLGIDSDTFRLWLRSYPTFAQAYLNGKCGVPEVYDLDNSKTVADLKSTIEGFKGMYNDLSDFKVIQSERLKDLCPDELLVYIILVKNKDFKGHETYFDTKQGTIIAEPGEVFTTDAQILKQTGGMLTTAKIRGAVKSLINKGILSKQAINLNGMLVGSLYSFLT